MGSHDKFKFSVTIRTSDFPLVSAMRGLAYFCEQHTYPQISSGGTKHKDWLQGGKSVTFRLGVSPELRRNPLDFRAA